MFLAPGGAGGGVVGEDAEAGEVASDALHDAVGEAGADDEVVVVDAAGEHGVDQGGRVEVAVAVLGADLHAVADGGEAGADVGLAVDADQAGAAVAEQAVGAARAAILGAARGHELAGGDERGGDGVAGVGWDRRAVEVERERGGLAWAVAQRSGPTHVDPIHRAANCDNGRGRRGTVFGLTRSFTW
nr:hypothetical protein [Nannocystis sp.]